MTQIACLAGLYSRTVLHCMYLVSVLYKDVSHVHFDGGHATGVHTCLGCSKFEPALILFPCFYCTHARIVPTGSGVGTVAAVAAMAATLFWP